MRAWMLILLAGAVLRVQAGPAEDFTKEIKPILQSHCYECHGEKKHKADLNLETFTDFDKVKAEPELWETVLERVQAFEMPPEGKNELDFDKHGKLVGWLRELPKVENNDCDKIASDRNASFYRGYVMSRRLNRAEYQNTIRDLFGMRFELADLLPADGGGGEGFDTSGNALFISSIHIEKYIAAANQILNAVLPDKTSRMSAEAKAARKALLGEEAKPKRAQAREYASKVLGRFARRAFRRPVTQDEVAHLMKMYDRAAERGDGYVASLRLALKAVLVSPNFLFLVEPEPEEKGVQPLADLPLASKLSYFLWSSMPDEELLALAESGKLKDPNIYREQIHRMLADPKAKALGERFALQWLDLERLGTEVKPDSKQFPEFDPELQKAMLGEAVETFNHVISADRPLLELIDTDYVFVNERLAKLYGIPGVKGPGIHKVAITDKNRGGVTSMAAVSAVTSFPIRTSPVLRGRWVLEALLGEKVNPPPPGTPALDEHSDKTKNLSFREQLQIHRTNPECASCHDKMDPLGFGMENFDVIGRWRVEDKGLPIDSSGKLPSGQEFTGPAGLKTILMARKSQVMKHLVRKMTGYAYGRELNKFDQCVVDRAMQALEANHYRASILIEQIAMSFPFRHRFYPKLEVNS